MVAPGASWMPIGELSRRVGVSTDLLRKWERRYGVLKPGRTNGNQRLYSRVDEARVRLMISHVRSGIAPAQAAELALGARFKLTRHSGEGAAVEEAAAGRRQVLAALERYDETGAEQVLEKIAARSAAWYVWPEWVSTPRSRCPVRPTAAPTSAKRSASSQPTPERR